MTVARRSEDLCFYCHWFFSTDIAVGIVGLMFKRQQNESVCGKSVTVTERVFTKWTIAWELLVETAITNCMKFQQTVHSSISSHRRTDGRLCSARNTFLIWKKSKNKALNNSEK